MLASLSACLTYRHEYLIRQVCGIVVERMAQIGGSKRGEGPKHRVRYDDGVSEELHLGDEAVQLLPKDEGMRNHACLDLGGYSGFWDEVGWRERRG